MDTYVENKLDGFLSLTDHINEICRPLFLSTTITVFGYLKIKNDSSLVYLCSRADWLKYFFEKNYHQFLTPTFLPELFNYGYIFGDAISNNQLIIEACDYFDYSHSFMIRSKHKEHSELFIFAAEKENFAINNWYINNIQQLRQFCIYFKSSIEHLLKDIRSINVPDSDLTVEEQALDMMKSSEIISADNFPKKILIMDGHDEQYITLHELQCLKLMSEGKSAQEIAEIQCRSPRTIETHIQNIKRKLHCSKRSEVIQRIAENNLQYFFDKL